MTVIECRECGRLWVFGPDPWRDGTLSIGMLLLSGAHRHNDLAESETCSGSLRAVKAWPALSAAFKLGGSPAAQALVRPPDGRHRGLIK